MIRLASRSRWPLAGLLVICVALGIAIAMKPAPKGRVVVTDTVVEILEPVRFMGDTNAIAMPSLRTLDAIADTLQGNPSIARVEVQHTSEARAQLLVDHLVERGVDAQRLSTGTNEGPYAAFLILKRTE